MKCVLVSFLVLVAAASAADANPIQKVLQMLSDLQAKIIGEGEEAQKVYHEFSEFCEGRSAELAYEIKTGKAEVADLQATIQKASADMDSLSAKIEDIAAQLATDEQDLKAATEIRDKEAADFAAEEQDLSETIDTIQRAITILERELNGGASLMQLKSAGSVEQALAVMVQASAFSAADASRLTALVQSSAHDETSDMDIGAPDAAKYENHSGDIIATLQGLLDKAQGQLDDARKSETASRMNYEMMKQSLEDAIKYGNKDMDKAKKARGAASETKATADGDLAVTSKDLAGDIKSLAELHHDCMTKATEFEEETKSRGEELHALAEAKKIISESTGGAESLSYSLTQVSLLQVSKMALSSGGFQVVRFVRNLAQKQQSTALAQLASRMASVVRFGTANGEDPFVKVKGLIKDMIERLLAEAQADATHKAYCDKEMAETKENKDDKEAEIEKLTTKINKMSAESAKLKEEVAVLQKELAELAKMQAEMDKLRQEEHATYTASRPEMEAGVEGIKLALKVLREYYSMEDKSHEAAEGAGSSIIGLLEVAESDFTTGLSEMIAQEEAAQAEYDRQTKENEITKATKLQDVKYKSKEAKSLDQAVAESTSDRAGVQTELDAVLEYFSKLKEQCVAKAEPYEEKKRRREAEIAGLKEALEILAGEAVLLQRSATRALRGVQSSVA